jgi:Ca2+-binding RTX toxin-like protein
MRGGVGADLFNGGTGGDTVDLSNVGGNLVVDLNIAGVQGNDTFIGIENLIGGAGADTFTGNGEDNILRGGGGDDVLDGGAGLDVASYAGATNRVFVDLADAVQSRTGNLGTDTLTSIEGVIGGQFRDVLTGTDAANVLQGGTGIDILTGGAGGDFFRYAATNEGGVVNANQTAQTFNNGTFGDFIFDFESGVDKFVFDGGAFGLAEGALDPSRFFFIADSYDGTNVGAAANTPVFIFSESDGNLYFDADTATAGYSVIANVLAGNVDASDIQIANLS